MLALTRMCLLCASSRCPSFSSSFLLPTGQQHNICIGLTIPITNAEQKHQQQITKVVYWHGSKEKVISPQRVKSWERIGDEGVYLQHICSSGSLVVLCLIFQTMHCLNNKIKTNGYGRINMGVIKLQGRTIMFPGWGCIPAGSRKQSGICWPAAVLQLLKLCLQPARKTNNNSPMKEMKDLSFIMAQ